MKWVLFTLVICACPVPEPEVDGGACSKQLVLGTESETQQFVSLVDGADLRINAGPQGGWHVWVSVKASATSRAGTLSYVLRSGAQVLSEPLRIDLSRAILDPIDCGWERRSDALVFMGSGEPWRGTTGELEMNFEVAGKAPVVVKRSVALR